MQSMYKDPPPYPGPAKQLAQPGLRQSYSGSETSTDPSGSSLENLSTSYRQDPPGEETARTGPSSASAPVATGDFGKASFPYGSEFKPVVVFNTNGTPFYAASGPGGGTSLPGEQMMSLPWQQIVSMPDDRTVSSQWQQATGVVSAAGNQSQLYRDGAIPVTTAVARPPPEYPGSSRPPADAASRRSYEGLDRPQGGAAAIARLTGSQPELAARAVTTNAKDQPFSSTATMQAANGNGAMTKYLIKQQQQDEQRDYAAIAKRASKMVDLLTEENKALRSELEGYYGKVSKLQKFEIELQKVQEAHECLVRSSQKRESLEKVMRLRQEAEIKRLGEENKGFQDQVMTLSQQLDSNPSLAQMKEILDRKSDALKRLSEQNKELANVQETSDVQLRSARLAAEELQRRVVTIEVALASTKDSLSKTEDELRRRASQAAKVEQVQAAFQSLQAASEKKEQLERHYRDNLERELRSLRSAARGVDVESQSSSSSEGGGAAISDAAAEVQRLRRDLTTRDDKILQLQREVVRWEEKFAQEVARRELAASGVEQLQRRPGGGECGGGCEARLAALEQSALDSERTIAEAQRDRLRHMEEAYHASRHVAELEAKLKSAQALVAEKDAVLRVFQRRQGSTSSTHSSNGISIAGASPRATPTHSPNPSRSSGDTDEGLVRRQGSDLEGVGTGRRQVSEDEASGRGGAAGSTLGSRVPPKDAASQQTWHV